MNRGSPQNLRRQAADVLFAWGGLEFNAYREDAAEPIIRRMLDVLGEGILDASTRVVRARGERRLGEIRLRQGHTAEALILMQSAMKTLLDLKSSGYGDKGFPGEIATTEERLARAKVEAGDLDGALNDFQELLRNTPPCDVQAPPGSGCLTLVGRLSSTADVYGALDRPNLGEPEKAAILYQQALQFQERIASQDAQNRQAHFDLAGRYGKLGDALWRSDPKRALDLYQRALTTATALVSKEQVKILREAYLQAISRPLVQLGRTGDARRALNDLKELEGTSPEPTLFADLLGDAQGRALWPLLLWAEGKREEARQLLEELIQDMEKLRTRFPTEFSPVFFISSYYRELATFSTGEQRRQALLHSAAAWRSWPVTSYTKREEQKDLAAANQ